MTIVVVDLIPALLDWEGRDRSGDLELAPDGVDAVAHLASHYQLVGLADADVSSQALRRALEDARVGQYFDSVGTSAGLGPSVNARVVRRVTSVPRHRPRVVCVTARRHLVRQLSRSRIGVVLTARDEFGAVPAAVASLIDGRVSP